VVPTGVLLAPIIVSSVVEPHGAGIDAGPFPGCSPNPDIRFSSAKALRGFYRQTRLRPQSGVHAAAVATPGNRRLTIQLEAQPGLKCGCPCLPDMPRPSAAI
jgi:hypothetical protein